MTSRSKHNTPRIVPFLPEGSSVDVPAQFTQYVCTEYGIVNLRGLNGYERAAALISIAHPEDRQRSKKRREKTASAAKFSANFLPREGGTRRYPSYEERRNYKLPMGGAIWGYDWDPIQSGNSETQAIPKAN